MEPDEDDEDGAPRYYLLEPIPFNYGFNPQTWESIFEADPRTNVIGDNDPIDMIEMSGNACKRGQVKRVKVLGGLSLVDGGETDWKIVTIDLDSPLAKHYHDITDLPSHTIDTIFNWFSNSKSFDCRIRKGAEFTDPGYQNFLARSGTGESCKGIHDHRDCEPVEYDGYFIVINNAVGPLKYFTNRKQAQETIEGTHAYWEELVKGEVENDGYWLPPGSNADLDEWTNAYTCGTLPKYVFRPAGDYSKRAGQPQRARYQSANYYPEPKKDAYPEPKKDTYDHEPNLKHHQPRPEYSREYTQPEAQKKY